MVHSEGRFDGLDNLTLYYQSWLPENKPKAVLLIVHGFGDHSGRYGGLVEYFLPRGYAVYAFDLRGHGKSDGLRGYSSRFSNFIGDLSHFVSIVNSRHTGLSLFLVGHSTGATISTAYAISRQEGLAGLILSGVLLSPPDDVPALTIFTARVLSRIAPKTGLYRLDANLLSRDRNVVQAYIADPLVFWGKVRARMGIELMDAMASTRRNAAGLRLPLLIMHGEADRLSNPEGSRALFSSASSTDKTLKLYPGYYHEIYNEPGRERVLGDVDAWLHARVNIYQ